jgi:hypothetical protein
MRCLWQNDPGPRRAAPVLIMTPAGVAEWYTRTAQTRLSERT